MSSSPLPQFTNQAMPSSVVASHVSHSAAAVAGGHTLRNRRPTVQFSRSAEDRTSAGLAEQRRRIQEFQKRWSSIKQDLPPQLSRRHSKCSWYTNMCHALTMRCTPVGMISIGRANTSMHPRHLLMRLSCRRGHRYRPVPWVGRELSAKYSKLIDRLTALL